MSLEPVWSVPRRVAFRFGVVAAALYLFPLPFGLIPGTEGIAAVLVKPWDWSVPWFAEHVLGVTAQKVMTGSGDTMWAWVQMLMIALLAAVGAIGWSIVDRRRRAYPRLQAAAIVTLRYFLCWMMLSYGLAKVFTTQFPAPSLARLDQSIGESSPMGLLWTFMGHSQPYTVFGGLAEMLGGLLLLFRRTSVLGALVSAAVMTNVVMLNFCYDVPVKLFSMQLLLCAVLIALPHGRRVARAVLGYACPEEVAPRVRGSQRAERVRLVAKGVFVACMVFGAYQSFTRWQSVRASTNELVGAWAVETFVADGAERPPLITDEVRWRKLIVTARGAQIRAMTDQRKFYFGAKVDPAVRTLTLPDGDRAPIVLRYQRPDAEHLVVEGELDGRRLRATLVREPAPLLVTSGFHWIQEVPFNR